MTETRLPKALQSRLDNAAGWRSGKPEIINKMAAGFESEAQEKAQAGYDRAKARLDIVQARIARKQ